MELKFHFDREEVEAKIRLFVDGLDEKFHKLIDQLNTLIDEEKLIVRVLDNDPILDDKLELLPYPDSKRLKHLVDEINDLVDRHDVELNTNGYRLRIDEVGDLEDEINTEAMELIAEINKLFDKVPYRPYTNTGYSIVQVSFDPNKTLKKIPLIKALREYWKGLSLKDAKDLIEEFVIDDQRCPKTRPVHEEEQPPTEYLFGNDDPPTDDEILERTYNAAQDDLNIIVNQLNNLHIKNQSIIVNAENLLETTGRADTWAIVLAGKANMLARILDVRFSIERRGLMDFFPKHTDLDKDSVVRDNYHKFTSLQSKIREYEGISYERATQIARDHVYGEEKETED